MKSRKKKKKKKKKRVRGVGDGGRGRGINGNGWLGARPHGKFNKKAVRPKVRWINTIPSSIY